jgi:hypothetical protein
MPDATKGAFGTMSAPERAVQDTADVSNPPLGAKLPSQKPPFRATAAGREQRNGRLPREEPAARSLACGRPRADISHSGNPAP